MTILYSNPAGTYHEIYRHIFDYDKEFEFYNSLLEAHHCRKILEIGCGSGMLARRYPDHGLLVVGIFDANGIFGNFQDFEQTFHAGQKKITRIKHMESNLTTGWTNDWCARYITEQGTELTEVKDITTLRAFTKDEIALFLKQTGFTMLEVIAEEKVLTMVAQKHGHA